ncbi:hypothetical protein AXG93_339s1030 [Marchantia polymorpha subsp. ruderalis]|uniref:Uncharacterized protein n=1 Tax=Marchantia polymorpha subsp. ruderalis TaxID=1480154 RepID=A0A176WC81_MARPO|nr:hypothetical protein AXG93_339s1030 [Marchantia polymorpha subsp. ruderalis]
MLLRWKDAPSAEEEKKKKTAEASAFGGMELGVPGDGPGVAAREGPASARLSTAPGEMARIRQIGRFFSFGALLKNCKSSKNGYRTYDYVDRKRRNVAIALFQILQPHMTTYMTSWQMGFVELALAGTPIHWARILWRATRQHAGEEKGGSINHLFPFLINFYRLMGCLTAEKRIQFPMLSRANRLVRDVEVDMDPDEVPASTSPARLRAEEEPRGAWAHGKRKWDGEAELSQRELLAVPVRRRANNEPARPKQKARKLILPTDNSADTGRAAVARNSPSLEEDVSAEVLGRSTNLPAPKARVPSEEARRPSGHKGRHAATAGMPAMERCLPSEQVPFDDLPSGQGPSA